MLELGLCPVLWGWCVRGEGGGEVGGNQGVLTIQTSTMTPLLSTVSRKCWRAGRAVVANAFHSYNACWNMRALNNNGKEHRR